MPSNAIPTPLGCIAMTKATESPAWSAAEPTLAASTAIVVCVAEGTATVVLAIRLLATKGGAGDAPDAACARINTCMMSVTLIPEGTASAMLS